MSQVRIKEYKNIPEYLKSLDDYVVVAEDENVLVLERNELAGVKICVSDHGEELWFQVTLCPINKVEKKYFDLLQKNSEISPVSFAVDNKGENLLLVTSLFTKNIDDSEIINALLSICNGVQIFVDEILK